MIVLTGQFEPRNRLAICGRMYPLELTSHPGFDPSLVWRIQGDTHGWQCVGAQLAQVKLPESTWHGYDPTGLEMVTWELPGIILSIERCYHVRVEITESVPSFAFEVLHGLAWLLIDNDDLQMTGGEAAGQNVLIGYMEASPPRPPRVRQPDLMPTAS